MSLWKVLKAEEEKPYDPMPLLRMGMAVVVIGFLGFMVWAFVTHLARGAHVSGRVAVESSKKVLQHREGGIVREIHVREGQHVEQGQLLLVLDQLAAKASVDDQAQRLVRDLMAEARLEAEVAGKSATVIPANPEPDLVPPHVYAEIRQDQQEIFLRKRLLLGDQLQQAEARIAQLQAQIVGNASDIEASRRNLELLQQRVGALAPLVEDGLYAKNQFLEHEAGRVRAAAELTARQQEAKRLREALTEATQSRQAILSQNRQQAAEQLNEVRTRIANAQEQIKVQRDTLSRTRILAPVAGQVFGLTAHTLGGLITPGQPIMNIVPADDKLIIEANVSPLDIDVVHPGMLAEVRFASLPRRTSPLLRGKLLSISRDVIDQSDKSVSAMPANKPTGFYLARIEVGSEELAKVKGVDITPGMPVEILLNAGERTVIDYLVAPWADLFSKAMRED